MKTLLIILLLCISNFSSFAQSSYQRMVQADEVKKLSKNTYIKSNVTEYRFMRVNQQRRLIEFTDKDVLKLESYFLSKPGILVCESHVLDKTMKIISKEKNRDVPPFNPYETLDDLQQMGFRIVNFKTRKEKVFFHGINDCEVFGVIPNVYTVRVNRDNCNDCGHQKISKQVLEKFKDVDYGGQAIDFNFEPEPMVIDTSFTTTDTE